MKKFIKITTVVILAIGTIFLQNCELMTEEDVQPDLTPEERIIGVWEMIEFNWYGTKTDGDGCSWEFKQCASGSCEGIDSSSSKNTSSAFNYEFKDDYKILSIDDESGDGGGAFSGEYDILAFENDRLRITTTTVLGQMTYEFKKK